MKRSRIKLRNRRKGGSELPAVALYLVFTLVVCCSPRYVKREGLQIDPALAVGIVNDYHRSIRTCRRIFQVSARKSLGEMRGEGILLYVQPGRYRIEVWDEMGNLVFHYIENEGEHELFLPAGSEEVFTVVDEIGIAGSNTGFSLDELKFSGLSAFFQDSEDEGVVAERTGPRKMTLIEMEAGSEKLLEFDPDTGVPLRFTVLKDGAKLREVVFKNSSEVDGVMRPASIKICDGVNATTVVLTVTQESVNGYVAESLFSLNRDIQ